MENRPTWVKWDGGSLQCWLLHGSFSYCSLGCVCFFWLFVVDEIFMFPLTSRVGADDLTRTWPVVDLSHICTLLRVYVSLCACVRVWRVFFCCVCVCACALCFGLCFFFASCCASFMGVSLLVSPLGSLITCCQSGGGMH